MQRNFRQNSSVESAKVFIRFDRLTRVWYFRTAENEITSGDYEVAATDPKVDLFLRKA